MWISKVQVYDHVCSRLSAKKKISKSQLYSHKTHQRHFSIPWLLLVLSPFPVSWHECFVFVMCGMCVNTCSINIVHLTEMANTFAPLINKCSSNVVAKNSFYLIFLSSFTEKLSLMKISALASSHFCIVSPILFPFCWKGYLPHHHDHGYNVISNYGCWSNLPFFLHLLCRLLP